MGGAQMLPLLWHDNKFAHSKGEAESASSVVAKAVAKQQVCALYSCEYSSFHPLTLAKQQVRSTVSGAQTACALIAWAKYRQ